MRMCVSEIGIVCGFGICVVVKRLFRMTRSQFMNEFCGVWMFHARRAKYEREFWSGFYNFTADRSRIPHGAAGGFGVCVLRCFFGENSKECDGCSVENVYMML